MPVQAALDRLAARPPLLPVLRTERLVLRPWQEADREPWAACNADPETMAELLDPLDRAASDALLDRFRREVAAQGFGMFAVASREDRRFLGSVGLSVIRWTPTVTVEIGWRFHREHWGHGYAIEAARAVLDDSFRRLSLPSLVSFTAETNGRSWRVMERLGMVRGADFDHPKVPDGHRLRPHRFYTIDAPASAPVPELPAKSPALSPPAPRRPRVWLDGDGCPRVIKELVWRAVERGAIEVTLVANRAVVVPRSPFIRTVLVAHGLDVADDWLVAHAQPGELVVTSDVPLAAELVAHGVIVVSPRGERFTPENIGEKLSLRDFFTEARASGLVEGGGPAGFDERAKRDFANALDGWLSRRR